MRREIHVEQAARFSSSVSDPRKVLGQDFRRRVVPSHERSVSSPSRAYRHDLDTGLAFRHIYRYAPLAPGLEAFVGR